MSVNVFANLARLAYLDGKEAKPLMKDLGFKSHKFFDVDGAQCHIVHNENDLVIVFRGTEPTELSDVLADLNAWPDKAWNGHGLVHNGFQNELEKLWPKIVSHLKLQKKTRNIYICGHSLGAAMATICASRMPDTKHLYTFGSPRAGTKKFVKSIKVPHTRVVNNNDIVTSVPLFLMGYRHHGELMYINFYGNVRKMTPWQIIKDKWRGRWAAFKKRMPFDGAYDHGMDHYCKYTEDK